jgi:hypothetical protein
MSICVEQNPKFWSIQREQKKVKKNIEKRPFGEIGKEVAFNKTVW